MRVRVGVSRDVWRSVVAADPLVLPEQTPEWTEALCAAGPFHDASRLYELPDGRRFVLPLLRRRGAGALLTAGRAWSMPPWCGSAGLVGPDQDPDVVARVVDDLAALRTAGVVVRPDPLRAEQWRRAEAHPRVRAVARRAHVLDLAPGPDALEAALPSLTRRNLRTAARRGVRVEVDRDGSLLPVYARLHALSVDRWAAKQNEPLPLARWRAARRDPAGKLDAIARTMRGAFRHYVAYDGDTPAASIIVLVGRTASYLRGAMDRDVAARVRANDLLQWTAIRDACAAGATTYHLHDSGESQSLARFKERLGAVPVEHGAYHVERLPVTAAEAALRTAVKKAIRFRDTDNDTGT